MKKNHIYTAILLAVLLIVGFSWFWRNQGNSTQQTAVDQADQEAQSVERTITKTSFNILAPTGWAEIVAPANTSLLIVNTAEKFPNPILEKLNFKTYYALTDKSLNGSDLSGFIAETKTQLAGLYPLMKLEPLPSRLVNGKEVKIFGGEMVEQGAQFKMMLAFFAGKNNDAWTLSFNTGADNWEVYQPVINSVIDSFKLN
ncbi:MAG: hypothetical protein WCV73_02565 [Patescibacteria group bacterium]|jgi:hypothetical protein